MAGVADLWTLQELDLALEAMRASLRDAEERLGETEELLAARIRVDELTSALQRARAIQKDIDLEADDLRARIGPLEAKLYSGTIRNPKELQDLQEDIAQLKRHVSAVEDRDLDALAAAEDIETQLRAAAAELEAIETAWREEQAELTSRRERLTGEIVRSERERESRASAIDGAMIALYEQVSKITQNRPVAKLDRSMCGGCRITLPTNVVTRARSGSAVVRCPNCTRILYA